MTADRRPAAPHRAAIVRETKDAGPAEVARDAEERLVVAGVEVARYVVRPDLDPRHGPRPHLHPVRTRAGTPVTDARPADHVWHLGASLAVQDVDGANLWGGRTYVRDLGYTWRDDHGVIAHTGWRARTTDRLEHDLDWRDRNGRTLLREHRTVTAGPAGDDAWWLDLSATLSSATGADVHLGSPATNGRPGGAGYGGFFWRAAATGEPRVRTADAVGEEAVNGSAAPWLALLGTGPGGGAYTLVFTGLGPGDRWFVRTTAYPGVCVAYAFDRPAVVAAGRPRRNRHRVLVADGHLDPADVPARLGPVGGA
ncbi:Methane oxygenase PmoA [Micromonospora sediminicola]|uniref:Methane oxygenase PmoA n=1 Tax=Micromonospora sediminicola TaxID=946078 RepID=A0A1A9B9S7_9ACTN|nr:PmoA family protein [Micromonospora sediminicola]SBT66280.1 Methane oxygenase PmoA [Micromonospora sediminicola]